MYMIRFNTYYTNGVILVVLLLHGSGLERSSITLRLEVWFSDNMSSIMATN